MALPTANDPHLPSALGRYRIVRLIGQGAMGRVLLAYDPVLDREVAVKHLRDDLKIPPEVREGLVVRMRHEARAAARVMHPHLVTLHDMGEDPVLGLYLVFEYVEGPTLKQRLLEGRLEPAESARLARELGAALTIAHNAGIVHRDIKPENIILSKTGGKIADFGIARIPDSTLTHAGGLMGTPAYSAPETFGEGAFSPESDQFSLAASMYEAFAGKRAFPGDDAIAVASRIANEPPARFAATLGLPAEVDDALVRAMAKRPEDRFPSCEAFGQALDSCFNDGSSARTSRASLPYPSNEKGTLSRDSRDPREEKEALLMDRDRSNELPREPKIGQILLGAAAVLAMAALLVRAIAQSVSVQGNASAMPELSASPSASPQGASSWTHKSKAPIAGTSRSAKPKLGTEPTADVEASAAPEAPTAAEARDAGADSGSVPSQVQHDDGGASSAAPVSTAAPSAGHAAPDAGGP